MTFLRLLADTVLDALFPVPPAEREILSCAPAHAYAILPRAPRAPIPEACSIFAYKDERVWRMVWAIKYKKSGAAAAIAGYALHHVLSLYAQAASTVVIIPMPITRRRRRERGFNQCELLADEIERHDTEKRLMIARDLLVRTRHRSRQTLKNRSNRLESAENIFAVNEEAVNRITADGLADSLFIVIDDVVTTGSTIKDAVTTMRRAGFERTFGLSVAH